jgi:hypothetical protein
LEANSVGLFTYSLMLCLFSLPIFVPSFFVIASVAFLHFFTQTSAFINFISSFFPFFLLRQNSAISASTSVQLIGVPVAASQTLNDFIQYRFPIYLLKSAASLLFD